MAPQRRERSNKSLGPPLPPSAAYLPTYYIVNLYEDSPPKNPAYSQTGTNKMNQPEGQDHEGGSNAVSVFGSTSTSLAAILVARVMSPTNVLQEGILDDVQAICQFCYTPVRGPSV